MCSKFLALTLPAVLLLTSCGDRLTSSARRDIGTERERLQNAKHQVDEAESAMKAAVAASPDLFAGVAEVAAWKAGVGEARANLQSAEGKGRELSKLAERDRSASNLSQLLTDERNATNAALQKGEWIQRSLSRWMTYQRDPAAFSSHLQQQREALSSSDLEPVTKVVKRAEQDWPAKRPVLEERLTSFASLIKAPEPAPQATPSALIAEEEALSGRVATLHKTALELEHNSGELYDSWDKILTDLDRSSSRSEGLYREKLKTIRTHFVDVPAKKSETHIDENWTPVSEAAFRKVENDIGMAIAHKDAGLFDSEAQNTPQPPGFNYVAPPSVGSNQYGYWSHHGGESVWTFLPQYLILRELLWNRDYHPVGAAEYNAYRMARSRGTTYYGRDTITAPPKYGTHGSFTQKHYSDSRYVQSGGFSGSAYASRGSSSFGSSIREKLREAPRAEPSTGFSAGKRFGRQPGYAPPGQRFGRSPASRPAGRSFGRRR